MNITPLLLVPINPAVHIQNCTYTHDDRRHGRPPRGNFTAVAWRRPNTCKNKKRTSLLLVHLYMCRRWGVSRLVLVTSSLLSALPHCLCDCKTIIESQRRKKNAQYAECQTRQAVRCIRGRPCRPSYVPFLLPSSHSDPTPVRRASCAGLLFSRTPATGGLATLESASGEAACRGVLGAFVVDQAGWSMSFT